jgi:hypothetical protein
MIPISNADNLENSLLALLEHHNIADIAKVLYDYADLQAQLAKTLNQACAASNWERQADALLLACDILDEVPGDCAYPIFY